jgi:hypothetical protein
MEQVYPVVSKPAWSEINERLGLSDDRCVRGEGGIRDEVRGTWSE